MKLIDWLGLALCLGIVFGIMLKGCLYCEQTNRWAITNHMEVHRGPGVP